MRKLRNEDGIALLTALMFTLITLGMVMALLQMLLVQTTMSGSQKNYRNSLEASYGGTDLLTRELIPRMGMQNFSSVSIGNLVTTFGGTGLGKLGLDIPNQAGLQKKLTTATSSWDATLSRTLDPKDTPDLSFQLKGTGSNFKVYAKIVDTVPGNSDMTGVDYLDSGAGVAGTGAGISPKHNPSLYTIEVRGERATNAKEKALLSVLYAY
jgi:hypothetical protein